MKIRWFLPAATAFAAAILATSCPIVSTPAFAQSTTAQQVKKGATASPSNQPKGKLYKSPGDRARCRMGNC